ncbi:MAG: hypothetical protein AAF809_06825 [Bacteroidota bacterium]
MVALVLSAVLPAAAWATERPQAAPDTVLTAADRAAAIDLIATRLHLEGGNANPDRFYLTHFDDATAKWPEDVRAAARARIAPRLTTVQAEAFVARAFARQPDARLAEIAAWLRTPLVDRMLRAQVEHDADSLRAFFTRVKAEGYPPRLEDRRPLVEALVGAVGYDEFVVSTLHRTTALVFALISAHDDVDPEAAELFVASEGAARARRTVENSIIAHQFYYRDFPDADLVAYTAALRSGAGQSLLALRAELDEARGLGFSALILDEAGLELSVWMPEVASADPAAVRRDRVRALLVETNLASFVGLYARSFLEGTYASVDRSHAPGSAANGLLREVFVEAFAPAYTVDQLAYRLADSATDAQLDAFEAWAADSVVARVFEMEQPPVVSRKVWDDAKFGPRDVRLAALDDALGLTALRVGIRSEIEWAVFAEVDPQGLDADAVEAFRTRMAERAEERWETTRLDVLYRLTNRLVDVSDAKVVHLAKRLRAPEAQAFLAWAYTGMRQVYADAATQAMRRVALHAEAQSDG